MQPGIEIPQRSSNRLLESLVDHTEGEVNHRITTYSPKDNPDSLILGREHHEGIVKKYRGAKDLTPDEKATLQYIRHDLRRIKAKQRPNLIKRILYNRWVNKAFNWLRGRHKNFSLHDERVHIVEQFPLVDLNASNMQKNLARYGFKNQLEKSIKRRLANFPDRISIRNYEIHTRGADYILHFAKLPGTDAYRLEGFQATKHLTEEELLRRDPNQKLPTLTVRTSDKLQFTAEDAARLVSGELVTKKANGEQVWFAHNPKSPNGLTHFQFDVAGSLENLPILEIKAAPIRAEIIKAIAEGKSRDVTLQLPDGRHEKATISLQPDRNLRSLELIFKDADGNSIDVKPDVKRTETAKAIVRKINTTKSQVRTITRRRPVGA